MKRNALTLIIGVLLLIIFFLLLFVFQVRQSEVAVVTTFGKPTRIAEPGPHLKWPWPIERVYKFDQRVQNFEDDKLDEMLTADNYNLLVMVYVGWRITDPMTFFPKFPGGSIAEAEKTLKSLVRNAKSAIIARHPLADLINADEKQLKFAQIEQEMLEMIRNQVEANQYGLRPEFLGLKKLGLPESVTAAVFERMSSERQVLVSRSRYEGEAQAQKIRSDAELEAARLLADADRQAREIRGKGEAEAARYLSAFQQNPELANFLFRLDALEQSLKEKSTLIFDQRTPPFDLFSGVSTNLIVPTR